MEIRFDDVVIDVDRQELHRGGELVAVQPQVLDVLVHLIRHRDRVVSKEELLDEVWTHRFVTESALTSRIKSARRAIGDNGREQRLIRTVHGRGYRFVATVETPPEVPSDTPVATRDEIRATAPSVPADPDSDGGIVAAPAATGGPPIRVPTEATPFVGREAELRAIIDLLADPTCRPVTIVAPGGMGRSRLAWKVAERLGAQSADGAAFVPLASVTDPARWSSRSPRCSDSPSTRRARPSGSSPSTWPSRRWCWCSTTSSSSTPVIW